MNINELSLKINEYQDIIKSSLMLKEEYKQLYAKKYLELAIPQDGSKKPSDAIIDAKLNSDQELINLKAQSVNADVNATIARFWLDFYAHSNSSI